ncbi:hypothetical protein, conserved [Eimeria necatrix]|uniref:Uncharacterized protein n=1 Tax=Eimeria necatrix TaxID=51315 RepID=U6N9L5_9EIME|nr:hypothetical protein, conserved [Eimeria necatrix]CDJ70536.1 hypothetical protein, conserved [Eimeria necatrix]
MSPLRASGEQQLQKVSQPFSVAPVPLGLARTVSAPVLASCSSSSSSSSSRSSSRGEAGRQEQQQQQQCWYPEQQQRLKKLQ